METEFVSDQHAQDPTIIGGSACLSESTGKPQRGRRKTNSIACSRCHARKVKCSGELPCRSCQKSKLAVECSYPTRDRTVKIRQSYLNQLEKDNSRLREIVDQKRSHSADSIHPETASLTGIEDSDHDNTIANPLLQGKPWLHPPDALSDKVSLPIHIGDAADTVFVTLIRRIISSNANCGQILRTQYIPDKTISQLAQKAVPLPKPSRMRLLVKVALTTVCRSHHIVLKSSIWDSVETILNNSGEPDRLSLCKLYVLLAVGEISMTRLRQDGNDTPGLDYFAHAAHLYTIVSERPHTDTIEIALLMSLYYGSLNRRHSAFVLIEFALRVSIVMGMYLPVPEAFLPDVSMREHRKRLWWTVYYFSRMWNAGLSHPHSIQDEDIQVGLPSYNEEIKPDNGDFIDQQYLSRRIELAKLTGKISIFIYGRRPMQTKFPDRVREVLGDLQMWMDTLPEHLRLPRQGLEACDISRHLVDLHLAFNQCVILATRPILLHVLRLSRNAAADNTVSATSTSRIPSGLAKLAEACISCARHSHRMLSEAWINGSLLSFDYFTTQYLFSSATVLAVASLLSLDQQSSRDQDDFEAAAEFLDHLDKSGNLAAKEFSRNLQALRADMNLDVGPYAAHENMDPDCEITTRAGNGSEECSTSIASSSVDALTAGDLDLSMDKLFAPPNLVQVLMDADVLAEFTTSWPMSDPQGDMWTFR